jgi:hypothetical protein
MDATANHEHNTNAKVGKNHGKVSPNITLTTRVHSLSMAEAT